MECDTGKRVYRSERAVRAALDEVIRRREFAERFGVKTAKRFECKVYECPTCYAWHMTSQPERKDST